MNRARLADCNRHGRRACEDLLSEPTDGESDEGTSEAKPQPRGATRKKAATKKAPSRTRASKHLSAGEVEFDSDSSATFCFPRAYEASGVSRRERYLASARSFWVGLF